MKDFVQVSKGQQNDPVTFMLSSGCVTTFATWMCVNLVKNTKKDS